MALIKPTVSPKGIPFNYFKIGAFRSIFKDGDKHIEVILNCYVTKNYREIDGINNIIDNYVCNLPYIDENFTRETLYDRIKAEVDEFKDATDDLENTEVQNDTTGV